MNSEASTSAVCERCGKTVLLTTDRTNVIAHICPHGRLCVRFHRCADCAENWSLDVSDSMGDVADGEPISEVEPNRRQAMQHLSDVLNGYLDSVLMKVVRGWLEERVNRTFQVESRSDGIHVTFFEDGSKVKAPFEFPADWFTS